MAGLTIYRASAGSGKTFAITREYIFLLFQNTENYKHILGVTFTNKATAEMKSRIVAELDNLSRGQRSPYAAALLKNFNLTEDALARKASVILSTILHDYAHFTILTIDSFFQRIIRAFAREIGFYQGFDIELDQNKILTAAVNQMIFELDANPNLKEWLVRFAEERIVAGSSWDVNRDIEALGKELFKENFKEYSDVLLEKITDKEYLRNFNSQLTQIKISFEEKLQDLGKEAMKIISLHNLSSDDFKGKSRSIASFFDKLSKTDKFDKWELKPTILNHLDDIEQWLGKTSSRDADVRNAFNAGLNRLLGEIIEYTKEQLSIYLSVLAVQKHLYVLGVVADLIVYIREYTSGRNLFLISDTSHFLQKLISESDTPFVYERTGTFVKHFMIDEFQDTSSLQWNNFKPLILNSLAEGHKNWVVGDVKQSIYRWRNSDWTILSEKISEDILPHRSNIEMLQYNWRSSKNIIKFNNSFFRNAIAMLLYEVATPHIETPDEGIEDFGNLLTNAYNDFAQLVPDNKNEDNGHVCIEFIPRNENPDYHFEDLVLGKLPPLINSLIDRGYSLRDIAILVRTRGEGDKISDFLLKYQKTHEDSSYRYDILSNDALLLKNSEVVKWLLTAFSCIADPSDDLNKAFMVYQYQTYLESALEASDLHGVFSRDREHPLSTRFDEFFGSSGLKQKSVYELCDMLIVHFNLTLLISELPFILAFQDMLQEYVRREPADLHSFLLWWEEHKYKRVINMPEGQDAIRLMTLHTAKGLEFEIVIVPFGDWTFMKGGWNSNVIWCSNTPAPFNMLELLPVSLTGGLQNTIFSRQYYHEKALSYVDNLNLLYVAFTRAINGLFVFVPEPGKEKIENNIGNLIYQSVCSDSFNPEQAQYPAIRLSDYWSAADLCFSFGTLPPAKKDNLPDNSISLGDTTYSVRMIADVVKQEIGSLAYLSDQDDMLSSRVAKGKIMHEVFQRIITPVDIEGALLMMLMEGKIREDDFQALMDQIQTLLKDPQVKKWFDPEWEVHTEADILLQDGNVQRPDRVIVKNNKAIVIDYKFGEEELASHQKQVNNYVKYIRQMNYSDVTGYLWYVTLGRIVLVSQAFEQGKLF